MKDLRQAGVTPYITIDQAEKVQQRAKEATSVRAKKTFQTGAGRGAQEQLKVGL